MSCKSAHDPSRSTQHSDVSMVSSDLGGESEMDPPVPIPNTEVKRLSADDTAWATAWEHRPVPGSLAPPPSHMTYDRGGALRGMDDGITIQYNGSP
jgi:hypothetical protein